MQTDAAALQQIASLRLPGVGSVEADMAADLCLYEEDPVERIDAVLRPAMVMKAGEVVAGALPG